MKKVCLIVDDVAVSRYANRTIVESMGFEVKEADSIDSCMSEVEKTPFDVIIMDWHLRRESGIKLMSKLKTLPSCASTAFVICTGVENEGAANEAIAAGAAGFLLKPTSREKIETAFSNIRFKEA